MKIELQNLIYQIAENLPNTKFYSYNPENDFTEEKTFCI